MTSQEIAGLTRVANEAGKQGGVECKYEFDRDSGKFRWNYYRGEQYVGSTEKRHCVIDKATRLASHH